MALNFQTVWRNLFVFDKLTWTYLGIVIGLSKLFKLFFGSLVLSDLFNLTSYILILISALITLALLRSVNARLNFKNILLANIIPLTATFLLANLESSVFLTTIISLVVILLAYVNIYKISFKEAILVFIISAFASLIIAIIAIKVFNLQIPPKDCWDLINAETGQISETLCG